MYLKKIDKSWRWGCELKFCIKWHLLKNIKYFNFLAYTGKNIFHNFINDLYDKRVKT